MDIVMEAEVIRLAVEVSKRDAEITQLRTERDGLIAFAEHEAREVLRLKAELAAERELADRLAEVALRSRKLTCLACDEGFNYKTGDWAEPMFLHNANITAALRVHATRRNK